MKYLQIFFLLAFASICTAENYKIESFGAIADGVTNNTLAIQKAIDLCADNGGGTVVLSMGTYVSGTIHLRTNVNLEIETNSTLKAIPDSSALKKVQSRIISRMDVVQWKAFIHADS